MQILLSIRNKSVTPSYWLISLIHGICRSTATFFFYVLAYRCFQVFIEPKTRFSANTNRYQKKNVYFDSFYFCICGAICTSDRELISLFVTFITNLSVNIHINDVSYISASYAHFTQTLISKINKMLKHKFTKIWTNDVLLTHVHAYIFLPI